MFKKFGAISSTVLIGLTITAATQTASASGRSMGDIMQECGWGGILVGKMSPISASSTNLTTSSGTSATTSQVLLPGICVDKPHKAGVFIGENFNELVADIAVGKGEHLDALNAIMSCEHATKSIRQDYSAYASSASYKHSTNEQNAEQLFKLVDGYLATPSCSA